MTSSIYYAWNLTFMDLSSFRKMENAFPSEEHTKSMNIIYLKLPHFPFPLYHHLWTQHHLFIMLRILCSWIFNLLTKWNGLDIIYLLCLESYVHGSFIVLENAFPSEEHTKPMNIIYFLSLIFRPKFRLFILPILFGIIWYFMMP